MASDPIIDAAERHIDLVLTIAVDSDARAAMIRYLSGRLRVSFPNVELARQNAVRLVDEAVTEARQRGSKSIDLAAVEVAWARLCPGLYPFC